MPREKCVRKSAAGRDDVTSCNRKSCRETLPTRAASNYGYRADIKSPYRHVRARHYYVSRWQDFLALFLSRFLPPPPSHSFFRTLFRSHLKEVKLQSYHVASYTRIRVIRSRGESEKRDAPSGCFLLLPRV